MAADCVRVLLIEDDENDYLLTRGKLNKSKAVRYEIEWLDNFEAGLKAIGRGDHDVALVDYRLGGHDGLELVREAVSNGCRIPIIVLTGMASHETDVLAIEAGAADFLEKDQLNTRLLERSIRYARERKRSEDALLSERNLLITLIDSIPDYIFVKDLQSRFLMANNALLDANGLTDLKQMIGKTDFDFLPAEIAQAYYDDDREIIVSGQALINKEEAFVDSKLGQRLWLSTTKVPLFDEQGSIIGLLGVSRNITERRQAIDSLREHEEKLETIFNVLPVGVSVLNNEKQIVQMNLALQKIMRLSSQNLFAGKYGVKKYIHSDGTLLPSSELPSTRALAEQKAVFDVEIGIVKENDDTIWTSVSAAPLPLNQGVVTVTADITERKLTEKRAFELSIEREKVRILTSFIEYSSHDLRTPLSRMAMSLYMARRIEDQERRNEKLDAIERDIMRMTSIIEEIQLLTKLESGIPVDMGPISIDNIVQGIPGHIQRIISEKHLTVYIQPENRTLIMGNAELLRMAFFRLLHNAVLYTPEGGMVRVNTHPENTWGVIDVLDTGVGIESAKLAQIFDHFTKVNTARTSDDSGAGLGLAITKKIMDVHNGKVTVISSPGDGSTFSLLLPLTE